MFGSTSAKLDTSFGSYCLTKIVADKVSPKLLPTKSHQNCCGCNKHTCKFEVSVLLDFVGCHAKEGSTTVSWVRVIFRRSSERLPCRVKSELNCFEHYNRHHTTENVACQKTNAGWNEYCHSSKLKHENWNMDEWMQNAISFWTAALCHQRSQLWSVHLWSSRQKTKKKR